MSQRYKVRRAREIAREVLGDQARLDAPTANLRYVPDRTRACPEPRPSEAIGLLFIGEVAARLGINRN